MARIVARFRVFPESIEVDLGELRNRIEAALPEGSRVEGSGEEPIAFGLKALIIGVSMPEDAEGVMDRVEDALRRVEGVGEVQVLAVTRVR
ncbi:MAG: translation elongation factor aEF-1 beta [Candidatus Bathyarchaeota archaeon B24]|nr:MAG: translation elongation factor aEF-1 beta [Candidatus Bathyarchaeota archaeon B24]RLI23606.1 MAG: elongation factor 1-beta [Candidatus Bathyarchaeota archaeon]